MMAASSLGMQALLARLGAVYAIDQQVDQKARANEYLEHHVQKE